MALPSTYLTPQKLAERLDTTTRMLERWRAEQTGPAYIRMSKRCIRYPLDAVLAWEAASLRGKVAA